MIWTRSSFSYAKIATYRHTKMIFRKEEVNQYHASDIIKIDGYISRFENDLREDYILSNARCLVP